MLQAEGNMRSRDPVYGSHTVEGSQCRIRCRRQEGTAWVDGCLALDAVDAGTVRVRFVEHGPLQDATSPMVVSGGASGNWSIRETDDALDLSTGALQVRVDKGTLSLSWRDAGGRLLVKEPTHGAKALRRIAVERLVHDATTRATDMATADGVKRRVEGGRREKLRDAFAVRLALEFSPDEALYGLGQHEDGILDYRGKRQYLYQHNLKVAMPVLLSSRGYGLFFDTLAFSVFEDGVDGGAFWSRAAAQLDYYFLLGPAFDAIVAAMRRLTGGTPMLPRWALGYVQSRERYESAEELIWIVREHRRRRLPLDCVVLDWQYWEGNQWGQKSFDPVRFPDPAGMARTIHDEHARLMISIWPCLKGGGADERELRAEGLLLGDDATCDSFSPRARARYWEQARRGLFDHGVDAWWCDSTEPFVWDWHGMFRLEAHERAVRNVEDTETYIDPALVNGYSLFHSQAIYEGQRSCGSAKRVVNLTRSASPGQQRYATVTWSGDTEASWKRLRQQIADGLNFCVTGAPWWSLDIGAFFVKPAPLWFWDGQFPDGCKDPGYAELYTRWFQFGACLPVFRSHGTDTPREIWQFGEPGSPFYDTLRRTSELRYRLLPYLYSLAGWVTHRSYTPMRLLAFDFPDDPRALKMDDQFMLGPALLVCPVTEPMYYLPGGRPIEGVTRSRRVYLPAGANWFDFWTGRRYQGGQTIDADAPLARMPLFVRGGAVLPMGPVLQHTGESAGAPLELRIYGGADGEFDLYEDEGDGYGYETGAHAWTRLRWDDARRTLTVQRRGGYPGIPAVRKLRCVVVGPGQGRGEEADWTRGLADCPADVPWVWTAPES